MKKAFQDMLHGLGEVNLTHAYYNGSCTIKDTEDPSWSTSFKTRRTQKTSSALEALWKTLFVLYLYLIGTLVNYNYTTNMTHPNAQRNMVPRAVLMKTDLKSFNTAKAQAVNPARPKAVNTNRPKVVKTARPNSAVVNAVRVNQANAVKTSACWVWRSTKPDSASIILKKHNYIDARGRSKHMTGNIAYLSDFKEFNRGYVTFGGGAHGGRISGKGTLKTDSLDFEDAYFVNELLDESQILLKIPRKDNMYSFDMKNIVPKESLTYLVANATSDESMLWHKRLGHINFKNINKLVKDNLVRGLPTKRFENDQTRVACLKRKQHRASCKSKVLNLITKPLFMLHMDLFGPTFVSSLMHKKYCLVVTNDYSTFTWVFFLTTMDKTSEILKNFIKEIEKLVDKKVKIIRSNNGTEFKNKVLDDFCIEKGIKREYSVARTPQQNGVAERRNMTLIKAARTMLADSKLPTTFWAEVVSTAYYVQNRVLVVKPHNMTPYELFRGFKPALNFMRPFGCHVTILNTLDNLGKFDGKSDEGFFVGYSLSSKAFRVYNTRTKRVEENLHIGFLENKPMIEGNGPKCLFDIDSLTQSMNYLPVAVDASYFDSPFKDVGNGEPKSTADDQKQVEDGPDNENDEKDKSEDDSSPKEVNADGQHVNTASPEKNQSRRKQRKETEVPQDETHHDDSVLDLDKAKDAQAKEIAGLKKRVQKLKRKKKSRTTGLKRLRKVGKSRRVKSSEDKDSLGAQEDASKQGRNDLHGDEVIVDMAVGEKQEQSAKEREVDTSVEDIDENLARSLQAQLEAELIEEERLARKKEEEANIALIESWDNTQAMMEADFELAQRLQTEE
ncbi:putative ribonuclease H-like domain-containing protein [Tanacetum coccineum]